MKSPRMTNAAALLLAAALAAPAQAQVQAQELTQRLTGDDIRQIARDQLIWCENHEPANGDCETLSMVLLTPDGQLAQNSMMLVRDQPALQVVIGDFGEIDGDRICDDFTAAETSLSITLEGRPAPAELAAPIGALFAESLAEFEGKRICTAYFRAPGDPTLVREEITVDGERRTDLEAVYRLMPGDSGLLLRPLVDEDDVQETTVL